jgi:S1-C subfamily serine protease
MGRSNDVKLGQWCLALGQPGGYERGRNPVLRFGRVLDSSDDVLVTDCTLVGGDSGGPLFDAAGKVIGIHSRIGGRLTDNLHVPVNAYSGAWDRLLAGQVWGHLPGQTPFLGVKGAAGDTEARVTQVFKDTPAQQAGVEVGDVVVRFDGDEVTDFATLTTLVSRKEPGQKATMDVRRGEKNVTLTVVIGKR